MFYDVYGSGTRVYRYAWEDLSFVDWVKTPCESCGRNISKTEYEPGGHRLVLEGGKRYPDFLAFTGAGERIFLVSERALEVFTQNQVSGIASWERVSCVSEMVRGKYMEPQGEAPNYWKLNISGRVDLDMKAMFLKKKHRCDKCGQFVWNRERLYPMYLDPNTWDGSDLCRITSIPGHVVCSDKLVRLIKKYSLKGACLEEIRERVEREPTADNGVR